MDGLAAIDSWPVPTVAAVAVVRGQGPVAARGPVDRPFPLASVTKLLVATAALVAVEEGSIDLDRPAGPPGATVRHLLAHASGLGPDGGTLAPPGRRRIYSNAGFDELGRVLAETTAIPPATYLREAVLEPLGMAATGLPADGSPARDAVGSANDLARLAAGLLEPGAGVLAPASVSALGTVQFPGLAGVVPGFGRFDPCDWGLGAELRGGKTPHWTPPAASPGTFGHFGASGTFLWVDPLAGVALVVLTDRDFGDWAKDAWPALGTAVLGRWGPDRENASNVRSHDR